MNQTYTPLIIEGKIYVVVDAPDIWSYNKPGLDALIERLTKYPTLEQHAPYWKERIGQRVEVEINYLSWANKEHPAGNYAIPPQQKQGSVKDYHAQILEIIEDNERECTGSNEANIQSASQINQLIRDLLRQQKQGDEWEEANKEAEDYANRHASIQRTPMLWIEMYQTCLRNNYQLIKRK